MTALPSKAAEGERSDFLAFYLAQTPSGRFLWSRSSVLKVCIQKNDENPLKSRNSQLTPVFIA
jgi:hypothetical protein